MPEHTLYMNAASAPCRAVLLHHHLVRDAFGPLECVPVDLAERAYPHDLLQVNPLHTVPTLITPWGSVWESRAILRYIEAMLPEPRLYPSGVYTRAVVDRLLDWDLGTLYRAVSAIVYPWVFGGGIEPSGQDLDKLSAALRFLDQHQLGDGRPYLCGPQLSIADISIAMTLSLLRLVDIAPTDSDELPHLLAWQRRIAELDGYADIDLPFQRWVDDVLAATQSAAQPAADDGAQPVVVQLTPEAFEKLSPLERARFDLYAVPGASEGERNTVTQHVACVGHDFGIDALTWLDEVQSWNALHNTPPLPREEVESIVHVAYKSKHMQAPPTSNTIAASSPPDAVVAEEAPPP